MRRGTLTVLSLSLSLAPVALADDLTPPPWRFQPDTTFQHWDFSSGPTGGAPDGPGVNLFNPNGLPTLTPVGTATWQPTFAGRNNVWSVFTGGQLVFDVPNHNNPLHQKELWLQITYFAPAPITSPGRRS
jgi:hypothetical protein